MPDSHAPGGDREDRSPARPDSFAGDFSRTLNAAGAMQTIYDPLTTQSTGTAFTRTPFPDARVPLDRQSKVGRNMVGFYPLPNRAGDTAARSVSPRAGPKKRAATASRSAPTQ